MARTARRYVRIDPGAGTIESARAARPSLGERWRSYWLRRDGEVKQNPVASALITVGPQQARWMGNDYESYAREGYMGNVHVYACIRQLCMAVAGIPWMVYADESKKKLYDTHPYLSLLRRPNPTTGGARFWENHVGYMMLAGDGYITRVGSDNGPPNELYTLRPDRVKIIPGNVMHLVAGYEYTVSGVTVPFPEPRILHYPLFHPTNDWYGMSPITAASKSVDQSNQAKIWNVALLQNGGMPSGALTNAGALDPEAYARLQNLVEEKYAGYANAGRPLLLENGTTWVEMGLSPKDMAWLEGQKLSAREICETFNIAPELIGDAENKTYSNYQEARRALYEENILPLMDWLRDDLNNWLSPLYDGAYADYDKNAIEALRENQTAVYERNNAAFTSKWITINDARKSAGLETDKVYGDFYVWQLPVAAAYNPALNAYAPAWDPNAEPSPVLTPGLPVPSLPPDHPLNKPAPKITITPIAAAGEAEPKTPPAAGDVAAATAATAADAAKADQIVMSREVYDLLLKTLERSGGMVDSLPTTTLQPASPRDAALAPFLAARAATGKDGHNGH